VASFSFVHAADLHLGSPFRGLALRDREVSERFAQATRSAFVALVERTLAAGARFLVIAGDVYDGEWKDSAIGLFFNREIARLDRAGIPVFLLRGNHDAESVVTRSIPLPDSVRTFSARRPETHVLDDVAVALHGQSFAERQARDNLARAYPAPLAGHFNIGVLHTSLTGRPPHADYAPCSLEDLTAKGFDYWALGHVHGYEVVQADPPVVYPGNLQGRNIRETGEKGAVLVHVEDGRVTGLERLVVDTARWARLDLDIAGCADVSDVLARVKGEAEAVAQAAQGRLVALRVRLFGATDLHDRLLSGRARLREEIEAVCHHVDPDLWLEKLRLDLAPARATPPDADSALDLEALLDAAARDDDVTQAAEAALADLGRKMPPGLLDPDRPFGEEVASLIDEARAVLAARLRTQDG